MSECATRDIYLRLFNRLLCSVLIALCFSFVFSSKSFAKTSAKYAKVTYVASEAVYVNAGSLQGLDIGDTLIIGGKKDTVAILIVTHLSKKSSACEVKQSSRAIHVGDKVALRKFNKVPDTSAKSASYSASSNRKTNNDRRESRKTSRKRVAKNVISGGISLENFYRKDETGAKLSSNQSGLNSRIRVKNVGGSGIQFEMRQRSRLYHRSRSLGAGSNLDEWSHQVYSLGVSYGDDNSHTKWGIGRMLPPHVRGMGYVDGGYLSRRINNKLQVGVAAGVTPDAQNSSIQLSQQKLGVFARYESGNATTQRVNVTGSLTSETKSLSVSRDFLYLQSGYTRGGWLSLNQSFEIEYNRGWRHAVTGKRFEISNYYGMASVNLATNSNIYFSYDARKNIRRHDNAETPDSLFDGSTHRGVRGGFRLNTFKNLRFYGNLGIRIRNGEIGNNTFGTIGARINRLPKRGHSLALSLSYVKTQFTTGYRPNVTYRFPVGKKTRLNATASAYLYKTVSTTVTNLFLDFGATRPLGSRYFLTGSYRQYFDSNLQSAELYTEIGLRL